MRNLDAIIRVRMLLCETSMLYYVRLNPRLQRARPLWSGASDKLIMPILPARGCEEIVFEHLEQLASPNLDSDSKELVFDRVETPYNTVVSVR